MSSLRIDRPPIKVSLIWVVHIKINYYIWAVIIAWLKVLLDKFGFNNIRVRRLNSNYGSMRREITMFSIQVLLLTEWTYLSTENNSIWIWFVLFVNYWKTRLFDFKHYCWTLIERNAHTMWVAYSKCVYPHTKNQTLFVLQPHFHHIIPKLIIFLHVHVLGKRQCMMKFYEL